jgi:pyruvate dehydrogenase E2 component (dihydrolipoyllysine-residue acetyltransferase)
MAKELFIPQLGQTVEQVTIVRWLVEDGAQVERGQELLEVETDKAIFTVEANAKGYLHLGPYQPGDVAPVLAVVGVIGKPDEPWAPAGSPGSGASEMTAPAIAAPPMSQLAVSDRRPLTPTPAARIFASPRARKLAAEKHIDLASIPPTGGDGARVVERDVRAYLHQLPKATPVAQKIAGAAGIDLRRLTGTGIHDKITRGDVQQALPEGYRPATNGQTHPDSLDSVSPGSSTFDFDPASEDDVAERVPLKGVRGIIAERMGASARTTARVTLMIEVDASELVAMRERLKARLERKWGFAPGYNDLLAKIVALALRAFPYMNARLAGDVIERLAHVNLGMAVDTERGLLVPVIRDADRKTLHEFGTEFRALVGRARAGRSLPDDLASGTFTITNLGMYDVDAFTPVINLPEAAILGVGRITRKPVVHDDTDTVVVRHMWTLSLVFDHRLVDGAPAARFLQHIKELIEEPYLQLAE